MTTKHIFENVCIDFNEILKDTDFKRMIRVVAKQSKTTEAKLRTDLGNYKNYGEDENSPMYFGLFAEWYAQEFLNYFGSLPCFNIANVQMYNAVGSSNIDNGVDGDAITMSDKKSNNKSSVAIKQGGKVYIQVKGTLNFSKEHMANDGSRLPNFTTNAMSSAIKNGTAYSTRYILFTTGIGVHYRLKQMWNDMVEIISINEIEQLAKKNVLFLNVLRERVGLEPLPILTASLDAEAAFNILLSE